MAAPRIPEHAVWNAEGWRRHYTTAWSAKYGVFYADAGDTKALQNLAELLDRYPEDERVAAQTRAPAMFAEFLRRDDGLTAERRHPYLFFVQEFGSLRVGRAAPNGNAYCSFHQTRGSHGKPAPAGPVHGCPACREAAAASRQREGEPTNPFSDQPAPWTPEQVAEAASLRRGLAVVGGGD